MAQIVWTKPALKDLELIINYIALDSLRYAERVGREIVCAPRILQDYPQTGRIVPEFNLATIRELIYGSYRIIYEIRGNECHIEAIIHSSRDLMRYYKPGEWDII